MFLIWRFSKEKRGFHKNATKTSAQEENISDAGNMSDDFEHLWAIRMDKGYQVVEENLRGMHYVQRPIGSNLTQNDVSFNGNVSSDPIIVEMFFGGMGSLWAEMS